MLSTIKREVAHRLSNIVAKYVPDKRLRRVCRNCLLIFTNTIYLSDKYAFLT